MFPRQQECFVSLDFGRRFDVNPPIPREPTVEQGTARPAHETAEITGEKRIPRKSFDPCVQSGFPSCRVLRLNLQWLVRPLVLSWLLVGHFLIRRVRRGGR